jgi:ribonuclease P protein component
LDKLISRADFDAVMSTGIVAVTPHFALHQQTSQIPSRVGAVVPKRWARKAVTRNLIKRQIYAFSRQAWLAMPTADRVIRLRKTFDTQAYISASSSHLRQAVRAELFQLLQHIRAQ